MVNSVIKKLRKYIPDDRIKYIVGLIASFSYGKKILLWYTLVSADVYIISYPKCGRTWLRYILANILSMHLHYKPDDKLDLSCYSKFDINIPLMRISHDDNPHFKKPTEINSDKKIYKNKKVVILIRDIRDAIVSCYFENNKRRFKYGDMYSTPGFNGTISEFVKYDVGSTKTIVEFYNVWANCMDIPEEVHILRYEDMHNNPLNTIQKLLEFLGIERVAKSTVEKAIEMSNFDNMRKIEREGNVSSDALTPGDVSDLQSYKTRKGKIGGYKDHLTLEDIEYINSIAKNLDSIYKYQYKKNCA